MKTALIFLPFLTLMLVSCEEKATFIPSSPQVVRMSNLSQEVELPTRLWEELEAVYRPSLFDKSAVEGEGSRAKLEIPKEFFTFHVFMKEKSSGIFQNPKGYDLIFTSSGGLLDFDQFLTDRRGSFYLGVKPELQLEKDDEFRVFYLSNANISKIGDENHGAGCDKFMDLTSYFKTKMKGEGLLINTSDGRHVSLLAGTYFFAVSLKGKLYLSQLTIRDSRFKKLHCSWK